MQKEAIRRGLNKVTKELKVVYLVTDTSTSIKAFILMSKFLQSKCSIKPLKIKTFPLRQTEKIK